MIKALLLLLGLVTIALALRSEVELKNDFTNWMQQHGKFYASDEFLNRWSTWKANALFIDAHNSQNHTYTVAMNKFGDLTGSEFSKLYKGYIQAPLVKQTHHSVVHPTVPTAATVDWVSKGAVTGIKNQGQCGSCWSFSATGSTEGAHFLQAKKPLVGLSEQNLVDCSTAYGNEGCNGGLMDDAFRYIIANKGIDTEASYPYRAVDGNCEFKRDHVAATLVTYHDIGSGSEKDLTARIAEIGPISVAIDASHNSFQFYSGGVYNEPACSSTVLDHGVLAVGYGEDKAVPYYLVKNSWGTDWGLAGYIMMSRDRRNQCGIATAASYPCATDACKP